MAMIKLRPKLALCHF